VRRGACAAAGGLARSGCGGGGSSGGGRGGDGGVRVVSRDRGRRWERKKESVGPTFGGEMEGLQEWRVGGGIWRGMQNGFLPKTSKFWSSGPYRGPTGLALTLLLCGPLLIRD
jgi:hypothetical protein